jgi:plastocyanin
MTWAVRLVALVSAAGLAGLAGCSSSGSSPTPTTAATNPSRTAASAGSPTEITIKNFSFSPTPLAVKVGQPISVTNRDTTDHTFTDGAGAFDTDHIAPATSKTVTLTKAGTYHYHCKIHPFMTGEIDVSA